MADLDDDVAVKKMFGPLTFEETWNEKCNSLLEEECMLCEVKFSFKENLPLFLKHLFEAHNFVVEDFQSIEKFERYVSYWRNRFKNCFYETIIPCVKIEGTNQYYFILSTLLKEDKEIRHKIKLDNALEEQEYERSSNNYKRNCLFCKLEFEGKCVDYIKHLSTQHNLQLGKPENLVYIPELITHIEEKLQSFQCIYCEKIFPDRNILKEHMRKKLHKRINPNNRFYDKFYIINYLEPDRNWQHLQKEDDTLPISLDNNSDQEWSDWNEKEQEIVCLFCEYRNFSLSSICDHLKSIHEFDFQNVLNNMDFYQKVKLVNYIRRQMHLNRCIKCDKTYENKQNLKTHLEEEKHYIIPDLETFNQPEFYFPTYENDALLYFLEDITENDITDNVPIC